MQVVRDQWFSKVSGVVRGEGEVTVPPMQANELPKAAAMAELSPKKYDLLLGTGTSTFHQYNQLPPILGD